MDDNRSGEVRRDGADSGWRVLLANVVGFGLRPDGRGIRFWELLSFFGFAGGIGVVAIYAWPSAVIFGTLTLVAAAAWLSGGVLGFLFGVPRLRATVAPRPGA